MYVAKIKIQPKSKNTVPKKISCTVVKSSDSTKKTSILTDSNKQNTPMNLLEKQTGLLN